VKPGPDPPADASPPGVAPAPPGELPSGLRARVREAERVVVFTGAGVSRESGLDTFRGAGGLWDRMRPEELATPEAFARRPEQVWQWYAARFRAAAAARPNAAHQALARWEDLFPSLLVVTQNVDHLHQRAGSRRLVELHGTLWTARCEDCRRQRDMAEAVEESPDEPPRCGCGGRYRPAVVWFGEMLPEGALGMALAAAQRAQLLVSVGTSATVYPAAGLIEAACRAGASYVEVNPEPTPFASLAALRLTAPAGVAVPWLTTAIEQCRSAG
jgi:NAD-dependent deacetylase